jgi:hypothetical protein
MRKKKSKLKKHGLIFDTGLTWGHVGYLLVMRRDVQVTSKLWILVGYLVKMPVDVLFLLTSRAATVSAPIRNHM